MLRLTLRSVVFLMIVLIASGCHPARLHHYWEASPQRTPVPARQVIQTEDAPAPIGPYSQAIRAGGTIYTSGQIGLDPVTGELADGIEAQTRQALANLTAILTAAGVGPSDVVKATIYLTDLNDFTTVNAIYGELFTEAPPARSTVQVAALPRGALVEIEFVVMAARR